LNTIDASNDCGRLGPTFVDRVIAMDPADVSTLQLFEDGDATSMIGPPKVLNLDDIATNCDQAAFSSQITMASDWTAHPIASDAFNRCSPRISWPPQIASLG
jgi:hypothetical protein